MKVSLGLPTHRVDAMEEFCTAAAIGEMARAAEAAGFDAVFVTDHPFPSDPWLATGGHHTLDPFVALSFAAAATSTIRLHTNLLILAYRNPFLSAKAIATLDVCSGGRTIIGVGAGYLEGEFRALGVDYGERNELTDEAIDAMQLAWTGQSVTAAGRHWEATGNTALPRPVQRPRPPIWIGGNSRRAIRRAVERADGWMPMPSPSGSEQRLKTPAITSLDELAVRIAYAHEHAATVGRRAPLEIVFMPMGLDMFTKARIAPEPVIDAVAEMAGVGVTYAALTFACETRAEFLGNIEVFGESVLPRI